MPRIGPTELIIILVIVMILFGVGRLPQIGGAIGKSIREFRRGSTGEDEQEASQAEPRPQEHPENDAKKSKQDT